MTPIRLSRHQRSKLYPGLATLAAITMACALAAASGGAARAAAAHPATGQGRVSDLQTFEGDTVGQVPPGWTTPAGAAAALVSDTMGYESTQSLRVYDPSATSITAAVRSEPAQQGADLSFYAYPAALPNGYLITLLGDLRDISGTQSVFHLLVASDGHISWYDGSAWTAVTPAGVAPAGRWSHIELRVPSSQAEGHIYVNGKYVGDTGPVGVRNLVDITGYEFTSDGSAATGDDVYLDDVAFGPADNAPVPASTAPFRISPPVTIAQSDTPVEMPTAAVIVPHGTGERILADYPAHTDSAATTGNDFAYSDDMGKTWVPDQAANPMPDVPSFMLTRLRNGELLAVDYHTYMIAGSGDLQAEVDTSVSHDNGQTWTSRTGVMTAPVPMKVLGDSERPGSPLGGFVLVHNVVEDPDGTLYQSGYGGYATDTDYRQVVLKSTDGGLDWTVDATVAYNPTLSSSSAYQGFCEGAISRTADGSLLIVMRTGSYQPMYVSRSTDNGATWSTPVPLLAGPDKLNVGSVYPTLSLVGGRLVLLTGRPGLTLLTSPDGNGQTWTRQVTADYQNSANGYLLTIDPHHLMLLGDRGANWSHPTPAPYEVWSRLITLNT